MQNIKNINQLDVQVLHKLKVLKISSEYRVCLLNKYFHKVLFKLAPIGDCWSYPKVHWLLRGWTAKGFHQTVPCHWPCKQAKGQGSPLPPCTIWGSSFFVKTNCEAFITQVHSLKLLAAHTLVKNPGRFHSVFDQNDCFQHKIRGEWHSFCFSNANTACFQFISSMLPIKLNS